MASTDYPDYHDLVAQTGSSGASASPRAVVDDHPYREPAAGSSTGAVALQAGVNQGLQKPEG